MINVEVSALEHEPWTPEVGPTINDPVATGYSIVPTPAGLCLLMCSTVPYGGWLAKQVTELAYESPQITFRYILMIDDATPAAAQVIETDAKFTDYAGWTYDCSAQWNIAKGWLFEVDDADWKWRETNVRISPMVPHRPCLVQIAYALDYRAHTSAVVSVAVDHITYPIQPPYSIPARQEGWAKSEIVTQLQQCAGSKGGGYGLRFSSIGYSLRI